jgi:hypothetical protein
LNGNQIAFEPDNPATTTVNCAANVGHAKKQVSCWTCLLEFR